MCSILCVKLFFVANFLIKKFNYATPGRAGNYIEEETSAATQGSQAENTGDDSLAATIIGLLGGKEKY
ncbi:hypothetical protein GCM10020331_070020 [Ectobacillus funiculus]